MNLLFESVWKSAVSITAIAAVLYILHTRPWKRRGKVVRMNLDEHEEKIS